MEEQNEVKDPPDTTDQGDGASKEPVSDAPAEETKSAE